MTEKIDPTEFMRYLNKQALFRGRWGYRRGNSSAGEYATLIEEQVEPIFEALCQRAVEDSLIQPRVAWGYFRCHAEENALIVEHDSEPHRFDFPRQDFPPGLCIADYFRTAAAGGDVVGLLVASVGEAVAAETHRLFKEDDYHDYLMLHGFAVELTDALAEHWHEQMRRELGIDGGSTGNDRKSTTRQHRGTRYSFGYPACPDLELQLPLFKLLVPERIGVTLSDGLQMIPEMTTSAIVVHHPQAKYFSF